MTIKKHGAFITYGPEDFTPGHKDICSFQLGDPKNCPVCGDNDMKSLEELVREQIGAEGPQLEQSAHLDRIEYELENMSNAELLWYISAAMDEMLDR